ncbi:MAG: sugar phosphate nucleotidyltransferase [Patescibacteria group bacterium]|jgi:bifunctional N-acetylglucosamine-1-phosphate-uridyltransferase/glucosamine-1-phosphate-acetyltransferase GlmU-like protein
MIDSTCGVVLLAAGKGTRLKSVEIPKVMREIGGKPIIEYSIKTLKKAGFEPSQICLVVGFCKEKIMDYFGSNVSYAEQVELKGTAHAAFTGMKKMRPEIKNVMVMGGDDSAFYEPETIIKLFEKHFSSGAKLTLLTTKPKNYENLGRIVRHEDGRVEIIEKEYLTEEQKKIKEISTGTFIFDRAWFEKIFPTMPKMRKLGEYGLPTALAVARDTGVKHQVVELENSDEWFGVNTPEELEEADKRKK